MNSASSAESVFFSALEKETAAERAAYLDSACGGDAELRRQVQKMLNAHPKVGDFLNKPVGEQLAAAREQSDATSAIRVSTDRKGSSPEKSEGERASNDEEADDLLFLSPSTDPYSLGRIGHYEVLQILGKGGFGIVLRAFDEVLQRVVALKVLDPALAAASRPRKRFLREARSAAKVRHENVVGVHAVEEQPLPHLVMEFIPGETLQQRLDRTGPLDVLQIVRIGRQIAEGLAAAHATGLIHRDIKPDNILLEEGPLERVKITDFGMARTADDVSLSQNGVLAGTPMYMAPEQAEGKTFDHRIDLFSLGSVLYVMATARPPFRASTTAGVLKRVVNDEPRPIREVNAEIPQWLCEIIARLQAKKPEDRFATATEVAELLGRRLAEVQDPGIPPAAQVRSEEWGVRRQNSLLTPHSSLLTPHSRRWVAAAAVLLMLLGGLGFTEATGVTNFRGTVIRLFSPEGTLVVEVDDPQVSVTIDGADIVITGAGAKEIRLQPGRYTVEASKDGKLVRRELVTVTNNGKQVVRVSQEAKAAKAATDAAAWERSVSTLAAVERAKAVAIRLQELNPGFDGAITPTIEQGVVRELELPIDRVIDLSPIRVLTGLTSLTCRGSDAFQGQFVNGERSTGHKEGRINIRSVGKSRFADLSPVKGLPLTRLTCVNCNVSDLTPLMGMKLKFLHVGSTLVHDLSPLVGMPLEHLDFSFTKVSDITPLEGMKLTTFFSRRPKYPI